MAKDIKVPTAWKIKQPNSGRICFVNHKDIELIVKRKAPFCMNIDAGIVGEIYRSKDVTPIYE